MARNGDAVRMEQLLRGVYPIADNDAAQGDAAQAAAAKLVENNGLYQEGTGTWRASDVEDLKSSVETLSGGRNTVLADDRGLPSIMVYVPAMLQSELDPALPEEPHPVFFADGKPIKGIYVSKFQNILAHGRAYSLPLRQPCSGIRYEQAVAACADKGQGWGLQPYGLWAALALQARRNGFLPHGNNAIGKDYYYPEEQVPLTPSNHALTGVGPVTWSHDGTPTGLWDMNGNVNEWASGTRMVDGELQIDPGCDALFRPESEAHWRAILPDGSLVTPGTPGTLKYAPMIGMIQLTNKETRLSDAHLHCGFNDLILAPELTAPPIILSYALYPTEPDVGDYGNGWRRAHIREGELRPLCGGGNGAGKRSGLFMVCLTHSPGEDYYLSGMRCAYAAR